MFSRRKAAQAAPAAAQGSAQEQSPNATPPQFLYVHYWHRPTPPPAPVYEFDNLVPIQNIQQAVDDAVAAIQGGKSALPLLADGSVELIKPSYAAFVMTPSQGRLRGVHISDDTVPGSHSFTHPTRLNDVRGCSAMYCTNLRWSGRHNRALRLGDRERYTFKADHTHTLTSFVQSAKSFFKNLWFTHENSGTNVGP